jgi:HEAT repeat protein
VSTYEQAVAALQREDTRCDGARALAALGDARAVVPLALSLDLPFERSGACVIDALETLEAESRAGALAASADPQDRRAGLRLLGLYPDEAHLPVLRAALDDREPALREVAARALASQWRTPAWRAAMRAAQEAADPAVRSVATDALRS